MHCSRHCERVLGLHREDQDFCGKKWSQTVKANPHRSGTHSCDGQMIPSATGVYEKGSGHRDQRCLEPFPVASRPSIDEREIVSFVSQVPAKPSLRRVPTGTEAERVLRP